MLESRSSIRWDSDLLRNVKLNTWLLLEYESQERRSMPWLEVRRGAWQMIWVPLQCYRTPNCFGFGLGGGVVVFFHTTAVFNLDLF